MLTLHWGTPSSRYSTPSYWEARCRRIDQVIPIGDGENPPSARHRYGGALHDPNRGLMEPPSETRIQMVRFERILKIQLRLSQEFY
jgi:hypothetical protein